MNRTTSHRVTIAAGLVALLTTAACASGDDDTDVASDQTAPASDATTPDSAPDDSTPETTAAPSTTAAPDTTVPEGGADTTPDTIPDTTAAAPETTAPDDPAELEQRQIVALGEEPVLADLLALGIEPIASSATVDTSGFQGIPDYDTSGVEVLPVMTLSVEYVAALQPEMIITYEYLADTVGRDILEGMAELVVLPSGVTADEQIAIIGDAVDRADRADELVAELDESTAAGSDLIAPDCSVSVAAIYAGPSVAAFVDGPWAVPAEVLALGCALDPDTSDADPDANGRAWLSLEQLTLLDAPQMILMQTDTVEGESDSVEQITSDPIWSQLPAVQADEVAVLDRLGYPGIEGRIRLIDDLTDVLGDN